MFKNGYQMRMIAIQIESSEKELSEISTAFVKHTPFKITFGDIEINAKIVDKSVAVKIHQEEPFDVSLVLARI